MRKEKLSITVDSKDVTLWKDYQESAPLLDNLSAFIRCKVNEAMYLERLIGKEKYQTLLLREIEK